MLFLFCLYVPGQCMFQFLPFLIRFFLFVICWNFSFHHLVSFSILKCPVVSLHIFLSVYMTFFILFSHFLYVLSIFFFSCPHQTPPQLLPSLVSTVLSFFSFSPYFSLQSHYFNISTY